MVFKHRKAFPGSKVYWEERYKNGGDSGAGSYNKIAEYKSKIINEFINNNNIKSIIEFGCGDGNQLQYSKYPKYIGLDVSATAIKRCIKEFKNDVSKSFYVYDSLAFCDNHRLFSTELSLSLDVIYHLIEDEIFNEYMSHLFDTARKYVIIYANDHDYKRFHHIQSRRFSPWVEKNRDNWELIEVIKNRELNWNDFYIYKNKDNKE